MNSAKAPAEAAGPRGATGSGRTHASPCTGRSARSAKLRAADKETQKRRNAQTETVGRSGAIGSCRLCSVIRYRRTIDSKAPSVTALPSRKSSMSL
jgi:hypothetical protein